MTLEELLKMPVGTQEWDNMIQMEIVRVPGGWIYRGWHEQSGEFTSVAVFVPEPKKRKGGKQWTSHQRTNHI